MLTGAQDIEPEVIAGILEEVLCLVCRKRNVLCLSTGRQGSYSIGTGVCTWHISGIDACTCIELQHGFSAIPASPMAPPLIVTLRVIGYHGLMLELRVARTNEVRACLGCCFGAVFGHYVNA